MDAGSAQQMAKAAIAANPANPPEKRSASPSRVPMDIPNPKLAVPADPNWYYYWHLGKNVNRAIRAGYVHVKDDEIDLEQSGLGTAVGISGNTDLGSNISVSAGDSGEENEQRLYLMKLPMHFHEEDMAAKTAKNEEIAQQLRAGLLGAEDDPDKNKRYMKQGQDLFYPKKAQRG